MICNNAAIRGSGTGSKKHVIDMLEFIVDKGIMGWVEEIPMSQCSNAVQDMAAGKAHYRFVLKA
jgi:alcohol dehydrogenase (NADP+)